MPRRARQISYTDVYHIIMRGINQEYIFGSDILKRNLLRTMKQKLEDTSIEIYGYCIMDNHIHILLKSPSHELSSFLSKVSIVFAIHYNSIHNRCGYVFQNRFKSYPIEDKNYFFACLRYIHNNPVKAKITMQPQQYCWSSFSGYLTKDDSLLDKKSYTLIQNYFPNKNSFVQFHLEFDYKLYPDVKEDCIIIKNLIIQHLIEQTKESFHLDNSLELLSNKTALEYLKNELRSQAELTLSEINQQLSQLKC